MPSGEFRLLSEAYEKRILNRKRPSAVNEEFEITDKVESPETEKDEVRIGKEIIDLIDSQEPEKDARIKELAQELIDLHTEKEVTDEDPESSEDCEMPGSPTPTAL